MGRLMFISADGHVTASRADYRPFVATKFLGEFDAWVAACEGRPEWINGAPGLDPDVQWDSDKRLADLEKEGVVGEVLFPNGMPFLRSGDGKFDCRAFSPELRRAALETYNRWLVDFCSRAPGRRAGIMQVSFEDVDRAVEDVHWAKQHGLRGIHVPGLVPGDTFYFDPKLDPIWRACEELDLPLSQHGGAGMPNYPLGNPSTFFAAATTLGVEFAFWSGRVVWQMILGGVFERFPKLRLAVTESNVDWIPRTLRQMDWHVEKAPEYLNLLNADLGAIRRFSRKPSEYWYSNCFAGGSFLSREEVGLRHEIGVDNLMFGLDYPHHESTYPHTRDWLRATMGEAGVPEDEAHKILGLNAVRLYGFAPDALRPHVDGVGFEASEILQRSSALDPGQPRVWNLNRPF
jgi:predicted TIM-barrel fold metal-dependent hydrolase